MNAVERILVVDDEPVFVRIAIETLQTLGLPVSAAGSVAEAEDVLQEEMAVVIIDRALPDGTGLDVLRSLKQRWPMCEAIMLTGYPSLDSAVEALRLGAMDYLIKPLNRLSDLTHKTSLALERRRYRQERERTIQELREAQRMQAYATHAQMLAQLGRMLAGIVHEVRSPLTALLSDLDNARHLTDATEPADPELSGIIDNMETEVKQIAALVRDVRWITSAEAFVSEQQQTVPVVRLVNTALGLVRSDLSSLATVTVDVDPDLAVVGSPVRLAQVLVNLVSNAAHAIGNEGKIRIRARSEPGQVCVEVEDTGVGMTPEVRAHLFEAFFTTKAPGQGSGLGLVISERIVKEHGGRIEVRSAPGQGTCMSVILPREEHR